MDVTRVQSSAAEAALYSTAQRLRNRLATETTHAKVAGEHRALPNSRDVPAGATSAVTNQSVATVAARPNAPTTAPSEAADIVAARQTRAAAAHDLPLLTSQAASVATASVVATKPHATAINPSAARATTHPDFRRSAKPEPSASATSATIAAAPATPISTNVIAAQTPAVNPAEAETASVNVDAAAATAADLSQYAKAFLSRLTSGTTYSLAQTRPTAFDFTA